MINFSNKREIQQFFSQDILSKLTILLQNSGYITIKPERMDREDWIIVNDKVKQIGGLWVSKGKLSHWSIPYTHRNIKKC